MTVASELNHNQYVGNGVTTAFDYNFRIFKNSHVLVQVSDLNGIMSTLVLNTDYTVTGAGTSSGGKIILSAPLASGWSISLDRDLPIVQETDLRNQGTFYAETHEDAFDYLTMLIQKVNSLFGLALKKPSWIARYYDALTNRISNLGDPKNPQDAATKSYADNLAKVNLDKTLRVPDDRIDSLPSLLALEGKVIGVVNGKPVGLIPTSGSATDVMIELAKKTGAGRIGMSSGNTVQAEFDNLSDGITPSLDGVPKNEMNEIFSRDNSKKIKVATWNTWGIFSINGYYGPNNIASAQRIHDMQEQFLRLTPDLIGFQELIHNHEGPFSHWEIFPLINAKFFGYTAGITARPGCFEGVGQLTNAKLIAYTTGVYTNTTGTETKGWQRSLVEISGRQVAFYNTHLHANGNYILQQAQELANIIAADATKYVVLTGDLNDSASSANLAPLINTANLNFTNVNEFNTNNVGGSWYIDHVAYRGFSAVASKGMMDVPNTLSDHKPFYAELEF